MANLRSKPPAFQDGQKFLDPNDLNSILGIGSRTINGPGVANFGDRITIDNDDGISVRERNQSQFQIIEEKEDYLICKPYWPSGFPVQPERTDTTDLTDSLGNIVYVAKPYILQRYPFDEENVNFQNGKLKSYKYDEHDKSHRETYTDGPNDYVDEWITPPYFAGEIIWAQFSATNLYRPIEGSLELAAVGSIVETEISVSEAFYNSIQEGVRIRIRRTTYDGPLGSPAIVDEFIGVNVTKKAPDGLLFILTIDVGPNEIFNFPVGSDIYVGIEIPICWEDSNEAGRTWGNEDGYPSQTFVKLVDPFPTASPESEEYKKSKKGKYYLAEIVLSQATNSGLVFWRNPINSDNKYVWVELVGDAEPNTDLGTIYCAFLTKGHTKYLAHSDHGSLYLYDGFEISSGVLGNVKFVEFSSNIPLSQFPRLYTGFYHVDNLNTTNGAIETLKKACLLYRKNQNKKPTVGRPYEGILVNGTKNKLNNLFVLGVALDCCDEDDNDGDSSGSGDEDGCPDFNCRDPITGDCFCCHPSCCQYLCWDSILNTCVDCDNPPGDVNCGFGLPAVLIPGRIYMDWHDPGIPTEKLWWNDLTGVPMDYVSGENAWKCHVSYKDPETGFYSQATSMKLSLCGSGYLTLNTSTAGKQLEDSYNVRNYPTYYFVGYGSPSYSNQNTVSFLNDVSTGTLKFRLVYDVQFISTCRLTFYTIPGP